MKNNMKKLFIISTILLSTHLFSQTIIENKVDEFTKDTIKRSSWEKWIYSFTNGTGYYSILEQNGIKYLNLKYGNDSVFSINKDDKLMFQLENGEIITLYNQEFTITCTGCGAYNFLGSKAEGINVYYKLSDENLKKLKEGTIVKVRLYTSKNYMEFKIKKKYSMKFKKSLDLFD